MRYNINKLRSICDVEHSTRDNKYRRGLLRKKEAFQHLIYNIVLERHALKFRLKLWTHNITGKPSIETFANVTLMSHLLNVWKCWTKFSMMVKTWDRIVRSNIMKYVFDTWLERGGMLGAYRWMKRKVMLMLQNVLMSKQDKLTRDYILSQGNTSRTTYKADKNAASKEHDELCISK